MEETMGDRIARLMKAKNLSQKEFAQAIESTEACFPLSEQCKRTGCKSSGKDCKCSWCDC